VVPKNVKPSRRKAWCVIQGARRLKAMADETNDANIALDTRVAARTFWQRRSKKEPVVVTHSIEDEVAFTEWCDSVNPRHTRNGITQVETKI